MTGTSDACANKGLTLWAERYKIRAQQRALNR